MTSSTVLADDEILWASDWSKRAVSANGPSFRYCSKVQVAIIKRCTRNRVSKQVRTFSEGRKSNCECNRMRTSHPTMAYAFAMHRRTHKRKFCLSCGHICFVLDRWWFRPGYAISAIHPAVSYLRRNQIIRSTPAGRSRCNKSQHLSWPEYRIKQHGRHTQSM